MNRVTRFVAAAALGAGMAGAAQAKTLVFCSEGSPEGFDPGLYTSGTTFDASSKPLFNRLVEFAPGTTDIVPGLAPKWEISSDGLTYTFHLRQGVKFGATDYFKPSRDMNADDVSFTFQRMLDKTNKYYNYGGGTYDYFVGMSMPDVIKSVDKVDDMTVKFTLNSPNAPFLADLAMDFASIMSKEYTDKLLADGHPELLNQQPVGTGPFVYVDYQKDASVRFKANPDYWGGKQAIDDLVFAITPDTAVRLQKLKANECQIMDYPSPADIAALKTDSTLTVQQQPGLNVAYLAYDTQQKPFDDVRVRKALNMAINKQAIIDAVYQGTGQAAVNPIPPTMWSYNKDVKDDPYDPEAAKKMLADAGVSNLTMDLWAMPVQRPYQPNGRRAAELIQADFAAVGVKVNILTHDWTEYLKLAGNPKHNAAVEAGWTGDNGDPDNFMYDILDQDSAVKGQAQNYTFWRDPAFHTLMLAGQQTLDEKKRAAIYRQANAMIHEQAPAIPIAHSIVSFAAKSNIDGVIPRPDSIQSYELMKPKATAP